MKKTRARKIAIVLVCLLRMGVGSSKTSAVSPPGPEHQTLVMIDLRNNPDDSFCAVGDEGYFLPTNADGLCARHFDDHGECTFPFVLSIGTERDDTLTCFRSPHEISWTLREVTNQDGENISVLACCRGMVVPVVGGGGAALCPYFAFTPSWRERHQPCFVRLEGHFPNGTSIPFWLRLEVRPLAPIFVS
jgi:hypothetical protein